MQYAGAEASELASAGTFFTSSTVYCTPTSQLYVRTCAHRDASIRVDVHHPGGPSLSTRRDNGGVELDARVMRRLQAFAITIACGAVIIACVVLAGGWMSGIEILKS